MSSFKNLKQIIEEIKIDEKQNLIEEILKEDHLFDILIEKKTNAWKVLKYSSFLDPDFIPVEIFSNLLAFNEDEIESSLEMLKKLSIIIIEEKDEYSGIKIHRSLQEEARQYIKLKNELEFDEILNKYYNILLDILNISEERIIQRGYNKQTFYYNFKKVVDYCLLHLKSDKESLIFVFGKYLYMVKFNYQEALKYLTSSLEIFKKQSEIDQDLNVASVFYNIGNVYCYLGKYDLALDHYNEALQIKMKLIKNEQDLSISDIHYGIGIVNSYLGKYDSFIHTKGNTILHCHILKINWLLKR